MHSWLLAPIFAVSFILSTLALASPRTEAESITNRERINTLARNSQNIIGLELIIAEGTNERIFSRFGHTMLRFVDNDWDALNDPVLSLVAQVDDNQISLRKGIFGGYRAFPQLGSLGDFWSAYVEKEKRPLYRFIIPSTPEMRRTLIDSLSRWVSTNEGLEELGDYTFFSNNCARALARLLVATGFPSAPFMQPRIPTHVDNWVAHSFLSPYPPLMVENTLAIQNSAATLLNISDTEFASGKNFPADSAERLHAGLSDLQIKRLLLGSRGLPHAVQKQLQNIHHYRNGGASLEEAVGFLALSPIWYQTCETEECAHTLHNMAASVWNDDVWRAHLREDREIYTRNLELSQAMLFSSGIDKPICDPTWNEDIRSFSKSLQRSPEVFRHFQLLLRSSIMH